jgi:hypothetical protein
MIHSAEISLPFASDPRQVFEADCPWKPTGLVRAKAGNWKLEKEKIKIKK